MDMIPLTVSARDAVKKANGLRVDGITPCVVYGSGVENMSVQCETKLLHRAYRDAGESTLVELDMSGKKIPVLFKAIQFHPVSGKAMHADFYAVNMKEEIETHVPVHFEGEAPAVKDLGGILVITQDEVTVRCLPTDLPHALVIDISNLKEFHDHVTVANLTVPKGVTVMDEPEAVLASIQEPREEEPEEAPAAAAEGAAPAEGEAAAAPAEGEEKAGE